jgi:hypothetical protein
VKCALVHEDISKRFKAKAAHVNIVPVLDVLVPVDGAGSGEIFVVSPFATWNLKEYLEEATFERAVGVRRLRGLFTDILSALGYLHSLDGGGVAHGGLSAHNILVFVVAGWPVARLSDSREGATDTVADVKTVCELFFRLSSLLPGAVRKFVPGWFTVDEEAVKQLKSVRNRSDTDPFKIIANQCLSHKVDGARLTDLLKFVQAIKCPIVRGLSFRAVVST